MCGYVKVQFLECLFSYGGVIAIAFLWLALVSELGFERGIDLAL